MDITYIILGILFLIVFALWWVFESGVFVDTMNEYLNDKEKPFDKDRKRF
jgi:nitrogen fixation-related uncharacterized protein